MVSEMSLGFKVRLITKVQILVLTQGFTVNNFSRFRFFNCKIKLSPLLIGLLGLSGMIQEQDLTECLVHSRS